jgi:hypothetical protein
MYPLRPELIESLYHLYRATGDPHYQKLGEDVMYSLERYTRVEHGFASIENVLSMRKEDRMPSYFLAETLLYLYLLFDDAHYLHSPTAPPFVFSTEGHVFFIPPDHLRKRMTPMQDVVGGDICAVATATTTGDDGNLCEHRMETVANDNDFRNVTQLPLELQCPAVQTRWRYRGIGCFVQDLSNDHTCSDSVDCGISEKCQLRTCSQFGFCTH